MSTRHESNTATPGWASQPSWAGGKAGGYGCPSLPIKGRLKPSVGAFQEAEPGLRPKPGPKTKLNYLVAKVQQAGEAGRAINHQA